MRLKIKSYISALMIIIMLFSIGTTALASENSKQHNDIFLPTVTTYENYTIQSPNGIPITVTPSYDELVVWVGNIGVDTLDNVTVTGTATDYGTLPPKSGKVPPIIGKEFDWDVPMTKSHMNYDVTITVVDGSGTRILTGHAELKYTENQLATIGWGKGSFSSRTASLDYHFDKHHDEVNTSNLYEYLIAADECRQDVANNPSDYIKTVSSGATPAHKYKNRYDGRFIILADSNNEILSFGR